MQCLNQLGGALPNSFGAPVSRSCFLLGKSPLGRRATAGVSSFCWFISLTDQSGEDSLIISIRGSFEMEELVPL